MIAHDEKPEVEVIEVVMPMTQYLHYIDFLLCSLKAMQNRFIVSHQRPLHLRPAALQTMTHPLLMAVAR